RVPVALRAGVAAFAVRVPVALRAGVAAFAVRVPVALRAGVAAFAVRVPVALRAGAAAFAVRVPVALRAGVAFSGVALALLRPAGFFAAAGAFAAVLRPAVLALRVPALRRVVLMAIGCARDEPLSLLSLTCWISLPTQTAATVAVMRGTPLRRFRGRLEACHQPPGRIGQATRTAMRRRGHDAHGTLDSRSCESRSTGARLQHAIFTRNLLVNEIRRNPLQIRDAMLRRIAFRSLNE
ncbi:hypothetical protein QMO56_25255, partial [Roseomonas sp. E05]|uniref:hypothetical protein n=1 Tax=Roseomonas sp. E05 TaxID=3046310 RepID=UPI0024BAFFF3